MADKKQPPPCSRCDTTQKRQKDGKLVTVRHPADSPCAREARRWGGKAADAAADGLDAVADVAREFLLWTANQPAWVQQDLASWYAFTRNARRA